MVRELGREQVADQHLLRQQPAILLGVAPDVAAPELAARRVRDHVGLVR